jgi:hypothetical protein
MNKNPAQFGYIHSLKSPFILRPVMFSGLIAESFYLRARRGNRLIVGYVTVSATPLSDKMARSGNRLSGRAKYMYEKYLTWLKIKIAQLFSFM